MLALLISIALAAPAAAPATLTLTPPTDQASLEKLIGQAGCHWASKASVFCLDVDVDMGFATIAMAVYAIKPPTPGKPSARFVVYRDGSTAFDAQKFDKAAWDAGMALITAQAFARGRREKSAISGGKISLPGVRWALPKPTWTDAKAVKCCQWRVERATRFADSAAVELGVDCRYTADPAKKADACYMADYSDETRDRSTLIVVGAAPPR